MALVSRHRFVLPAIAGVMALVGLAANPARSQSASPTTTQPTPQQPTPADSTPVDGDIIIEDGSGSGRVRSNNVAAVPVVVNGPQLQINTEQRAVATFSANAGQTVVIRSNRPWSLDDPFGENSAGSNFGFIKLTATGKYLVNMDAALQAPATLSVRTIDSNTTTIVIPLSIGQVATFNADDVRQQIARVRLIGGQRYRLVMPDSQRGGSVCASEREQVVFENTIACVFGSINPSLRQPEYEKTFALDHDATVELQATDFASDNGVALPLRAAIQIADNDLIADTSTNPIVESAPGFDQSIVIPFWGSPAQRAVISSPAEALVAPWGDPWIDKEDGVKVAAVPVVYAPTKPPFVAWQTSDKTKPEVRRYGIYRGEDNAVSVPATGEQVLIRNQPWFAAVGSMKLNPGDRYILQVTGTSIRPVSLGLRDPSGKFSSALSPWQWTEDNGKQRAVTGFTADRGGLWALELRPSGNAVKDMQISLLKVGGGGSYEGSVEIDDVLTIGEKTDIQLGPNEFARLTVKLKSPIPQIVQPEVLRYRNNTFQPTAVDLSLWDSKGRLVWSNNRNLEEEVLSGRLGKEPQLSEKFATVSSAEPYTLVVDPHTDLAGRFRIGVTSTAVFSDVALGNGPIPVLLDGTRTGVVEVRTPTRYRLTGASACVSITSFAQWDKVKRCIARGQTISLPVGVHRLEFVTPVQGNARFEPVEAGAPPDPVPTVTAAIDGPWVSLPSGAGIGRVNIDLKAGDRIVPVKEIVFEAIGGRQSISVPDDGSITNPDGTWTGLRGLFVAPANGRYVFAVALSEASGRSIRVVRAAPEVQTASIAIGAKFKIYNLKSAQRLEASVKVNAKTRMVFDTFGYVEFLYAADAKERRFILDESGSLVLPPGTYRFVFTGGGPFRIALKKVPLNQP